MADAGRPGRVRRPGLAPLPMVLGIVIGLRSADGELRLQLQEVLLPDAADVHQLLDLLEWSVLLPVFENARSGLGADAGKPFEVGGGCRVDVDSDGRQRRLRGRTCRPALRRSDG